MTSGSRNPSDAKGLAARIVLHLAQMPPLGPNSVARLVATQQGMVATLHVPQGSLVRALRPLLAAEVVKVERRYVAETNRRMKVYGLTALGAAAARHLDRIATPSYSPAPSDGGDDGRDPRRWSPAPVDRSALHQPLGTACTGR